MNEIFIAGRLTKDPEAKTTSNANEMVKFSVADDHGFGDKKTTNFWDCTAFGKLAAFVSAYCKKGSAVIITGRVEITKKDDGKKYIDVVVGSIEFQRGNYKEDATQQPMQTVAPLAEIKPGEELPF